jgi:serine/threonine protein kinase
VAGDQPIDGRTDIYSLGCVMYWLLTGHMVFEGSSAMRTMLMHLNEKPVPPSQRTAMETPAGLEQIIMQCLEKDPEEQCRRVLDIFRPPADSVRPEISEGRTLPAESRRGVSGVSGNRIRTR